MVGRLRFFICAVLSVTFLSNCNSTHASSSVPEEEIVKQLSHNRIVMLGDFAHEYPLPYHTLTSVLTTWLTRLQEGQSDVRRLTLFIEEDEQLANLLKQYFRTGDLNPIFKYFLPSTSIEHFEFYADLRRIVGRIDSLNRASGPSHQITFDLQGPESKTIFSPGASDSSAKSALLYYVKDRDSLSAMNIINYFKEYPDRKGLIFYGDGHLIKNVVEKKNFTKILTRAERMGAYIGYYLKKEYGEDQIFTINQVALERSTLKFTEPDHIDRLYRSAEVPWKDSPQEYAALSPENMDAFIVLHGFVVQNHPWQYVFSKKIVDAAIRRLDSTAAHRSGVFGERYYQQAQRTLCFLYDTTFSSPEQWIAWSSTHPLDGMKTLLSDSYHNRLANKGSAALGTPGLGKFIDNLINQGFDPRVGSPKMSREEWERDFDRMWPQIVSLNAIGIYWVGDAGEQAEAKAYLANVSGENYSEPDQYLKWWRKNFFNSTF